MKNYNKVFVYFFFIILLFNCSYKEKEEKFVKPKKNLPLNIIYSEAYKNFEQGKYQDAIDLFEEVEKNYGYTEWASKALLFKAYINYESNKLIESLEILKKFKKLYPASKNLDYVEYLIAMCLFDQVSLTSRDQTATYLAAKQFNKILKDYPDTVYAEDIKFKFDLLNDQLAGKEMYVGRYYQKKRKWLPALNRFHNVLKNYQTTIYVEEAIHRIVEINYIIGNIDEAKKYASIMSFNYNKSSWYEETYNIFNNKNNLNKNKSKILKEKLKKLLE